MKNILCYKLFESKILTESLSETHWPSDWKSMPEWKLLQNIGFYDATTPLQDRNQTIMLKNTDKRFNNLYPEGIVLQKSGYIRDKSARSGFIKSYKKEQFTLNQMFDYLIDRFSRQLSKGTEMVKKYSDLPEDAVYFINKVTNNPWKYNRETWEIDVSGSVTIKPSLIKEEDDLRILQSIKFGVVKKDFYCAGLGLKKLNFLPKEVGRDLFAGMNKIEDLKGFPKKIGNRLYLSDSPELKTLEGLNIDGDVKGLSTSFFAINEVNIESLLSVFDMQFRNPENRTIAEHLVKSILTPEYFAPYFQKNPLKLYVLDNFPELKNKILKITGLRDVSKLGRDIRQGLVF
jgi:hypothetical protein